MILFDIIIGNMLTLSAHYGLNDSALMLDNFRNKTHWDTFMFVCHLVRNLFCKILGLGFHGLKAIFFRPPSLCKFGTHHNVIIELLF